VSAFQIVVVVWLLLLSCGFGLLVTFFFTWVKHHNALDTRVKRLEQDKRGNPFAKKGMDVVRKGKERKKSNG
jgi:putative component of membrane protein insertase Oxa1/YidC/SpoIIIJ protein YidD